MEKHSNIKLAFWLNLGFALIELVGAFFTNSVAIASDAIHDLGDGLAIGIAWYLERSSGRARDSQFSFGYKRFSLLGALINCLILVFGSILILREILPRVFEPQAVHSEGMLFLAIFGIVFNGFAALRLTRGRSMNEEVLSLHFLEDVLGWVAVLVVAIAIQFGDYSILDPLLALLIAFWVIWNAVKKLRRTLKIFLQSLPENLDIPQVEKRIAEQAQVVGVHDTCLWSLDGEHHVLSAHVLVVPEFKPESANALKAQIRKVLLPLGIQHATLELEWEGEACPL
ncbi:MAG: cation transporter [Deltaproteobacteria bacterium]|nr:cation transporter [Deltaproteobacteria bacterium]